MAFRHHGVAPVARHRAVRDEAFIATMTINAYLEAAAMTGHIVDEPELAGLLLTDAVPRLAIPPLSKAVFSVFDQACHENPASEKLRHRTILMHLTLVAFAQRPPWIFQSGSAQAEPIGPANVRVLVRCSFANPDPHTSKQSRCSLFPFPLLYAESGFARQTPSIRYYRSGKPCSLR